MRLDGARLRINAIARAAATLSPKEPAMTDPVDIAELRRLEAAATPLPWAVDPGTNGTEAVAYTSRLPDQGWLVRQSILRGTWQQPNAVANSTLAFAAVNALPDLLARLEALSAEREGLIEALTPSGETKAAYIGEFKFKTCVGFDEDSHDIMAEITVPWTTIKEIMAAIAARAALSPQKEHE